MDMVEVFPWMPLLFDMKARSVTDQLTRPKMDFKRRLKATNLGLSLKRKQQKMITKWSENRQDTSKTSVNSIVLQRTIKILFLGHLRKKNQH